MTSDSMALLMQSALFGEVSPALRAAGFKLDHDRVTLVFYYDGAITEADAESASCVETEVIAGLPSKIQVISEIKRLDSPTRLPSPDRWVYSRRE